MLDNKGIVTFNGHTYKWTMGDMEQLHALYPLERGESRGLVGITDVAKFATSPKGLQPAVELAAAHTDAPIPEKVIDCLKLVDQLTLALYMNEPIDLDKAIQAVEADNANRGHAEDEEGKTGPLSSSAPAAETGA